MSNTKTDHLTMNRLIVYFWSFKILPINWRIIRTDLTTYVVLFIEHAKKNNSNNCWPSHTFSPSQS